jgi:hypothetical protein
VTRGAALLTTTDDRAVLEPHPFDRATGAQLDHGHSGAGAYGHPALPRRSGERVRDAAHPADHHAPHPRRPFDPAEDVVKKEKRGPGLVYAAVRPDDGLRAQERLELVRLEPVIDDVGDTPGRELHEEVRVERREPPGLTTDAQQVEEVAWCAAVEARRRLQDLRLEERAGALEGGVEARPRLGVARREPGDLARVALVAPEGQRAAVGIGDEERRLLPDDTVAVARQVEAPDDLGQEKRADVRGRRDLVSGEQLLRDAGAADELARLEHGDPVPGLGKEPRGHEAVVPRADDHHITRPHRRPPVSAALRALDQSRPASCRIVAHQPVPPPSADGHEPQGLPHRVLARAGAGVRHEVQSVRRAPARRLAAGVTRRRGGAADPCGDRPLGEAAVPAQPQARAIGEQQHDARPVRAARRGRLDLVDLTW